MIHLENIDDEDKEIIDNIKDKKYIVLLNKIDLDIKIWWRNNK